LRLFLDRSIGTRRIAAALRAERLDVETIADRYGPASTHVRDEQWIAEASRDDRLLISADKRIRYRPQERAAICAHNARCVTFAAGDLTSEQMIALFLHHLPNVQLIASDPGPYVYHLTRDRLVRMQLDRSSE
jgi:predicted nuclease of predicted toxin-antitoxin system